MECAIVSPGFMEKTALWRRAQINAQGAEFAWTCGVGVMRASQDTIARFFVVQMIAPHTDTATMAHATANWDLVEQIAHKVHVPTTAMGTGVAWTSIVLATVDGRDTIAHSSRVWTSALRMASASMVPAIATQATQDPIAQLGRAQMNVLDMVNACPISSVRVHQVGQAMIAHFRFAPPIARLMGRASTGRAFAITASRVRTVLRDLVQTAATTMVHV